MPGLTIHDLFTDSLDTTCLIQWVDFPRTMDKKSILSNRDSHAAVVVKTNKKWYILDVAEEAEICITDDNKRAKEYFSCIDYMNYYVLEESYPRLVDSSDLIR